MAWHIQQKLPVFKVTQRSSSGVVHRNIPRGKRSVECGRYDHSNAAEEASCTLDSPTSLLEPPSLDDFGDDEGQNVSLHTIKQKASTSAWANIRQ